MREGRLPLLILSLLRKNHSGMETSKDDREIADKIGLLRKNHSGMETLDD